MASMGEMIGNIAHQWRQPLSQLSGLFFDIESAYEHKELNKKYLIKSVDEANDLIEYMSKTIDDFKEFYNPDAKKEIFSIKGATENALKVLDASLKFNAIVVELQLDEGYHVEGLSNEFSQVLLNILSNARDIALERGISHPKIKIYATENSEKTSLFIEDNCGGIDKAILGKVFDPYFTTKYGYGSGIGLYMSRIIIENKMNGKISVRNFSEGRLRFTITLPSSSKQQCPATN
jgi:signal transduction histidine kinase